MSDFDKSETQLLVEKLAYKLKTGPTLMIGGCQMTLDIDPLDEFHIKKAERELREKPEVVQESIKILCDMLGGQFFLYTHEFFQYFLFIYRFTINAYKLWNFCSFISLLASYESIILQCIRKYRGNKPTIFLIESIWTKM